MEPAVFQLPAKIGALLQLACTWKMDTASIQCHIFPTAELDLNVMLFFTNVFAYFHDFYF